MKTVKVRIAVAVDKNGGWGSCGWTGASDSDLQDAAYEQTPDTPILVTWVEAEIPLPQTVTGMVSE